MVISEAEQLRLIDYFFDTLHPEICKDDYNLALISNFIRSRTGAEYLNLAALEWAISDLAGRLHYYQHVDISAQLAAGAEAEKKLAEEQDEKNKKARALEHQQRLEAAQLARTPGVASAFEGAIDRAESERQARLEAQKVRDSMTLRARHAEFDQLVKLARMESNAEIHSRKSGRWATLYAKIKQRFPEPVFHATL